MAITNWNNFMAAKPQDPWYADIVENAFNGYKMGRAPATMDLEDNQKKLANSLQELALKHKPREYELSDALKQAQIAKANRPASDNLSGALANAFKLRERFDKGTPEYDQVNNYINKLGTSGNGVQVTGTPGGEFKISVGGQAEGPEQNISIPGLPKLKTGETYLYDDNQKPIGVGKPLSEAEKKESAGREFFNEVQPFLNESQAPYSGKGATKQFESDVINYKSDQEAKKRIDNLLAADKLLFSGVVKENATLGGANTNKVYDRLTKSLKNSEVYPLLKEIAKYQLPQGYTQSSGEIFNQVLNKATQKSDNLPAYKPFYFNSRKDKDSGSDNDLVYNPVTGRLE